MTAFTPTHRSKVKRLHERGRYDEESVFAILDAGIVAHIGTARRQAACCARRRTASRSA
jgi:hypothetical protein